VFGCAGGQCNQCLTEGTTECLGTQIRTCLRDASGFLYWSQYSSCFDDPHGSPTCSTGQCGTTCDATYRLCAGGCAVCPTSGVDSWGCDGPMCVVTACQEGYAHCSGSCVTESIYACGDTCEQCSIPAHGQATCSQGACGIDCSEGYSECVPGSCRHPDSDTCEADSDCCNGSCIQSKCVQPGAFKWKVQVSASGLPAIGTDGTIYLGTFGLQAIDPDGGLKWTYRSGTSLSIPVISQAGTIYVGTEGSDLYEVSSNGNAIRTIAVSGLDLGPSIPAIGADGTIYVARSVLNAMNPDGSQKWTSPISSLGGAVIDSSGNVIVGGSPVNAISPGGTLYWDYSFGSDLNLSEPALGGDGTVYLLAVEFLDHDVIGYLVALTSAGAYKWEYSTHGIFFPMAIGSDGTIYLGASDGNLHAVNPDGTLKWMFLTGSEYTSAVTIGSGGTVFFGSSDGHLNAISPSGTVKWQYLTGGAVGAPSLGDDGTIYVRSNDGYLYALYGEEQLADSPWPKDRANLKNTGKR
jgi:outer membrane protein assembly factor BamB